MRGLKVEVIAFQGSSPRDVPRILQSLVRLTGRLRTLRPDVVHYHLIKAIIVGRLAAWFAGVPGRFSQLGGPLTLEMKSFRYLDLATAFIDHAIISPSLAVQRIYQTYWTTRAKTALVYYGFDQTRFVEAARSDAGRSLRLQLGLQNEIVFTMVAYMYGSQFRRFQGVGIKGHEVLLRAARDVLRQRSDIRFLIVGEDQDGSRVNLDRLRAMAAQLGIVEHIHFLGHRSDVADILAASDFAVVPSISENCGGAVEPMAVGVPVIASQVGGLPELVIPGVTGLCFPVGDAEGLTETILQAAALSPATRDRLGTNGRTLVGRLFDPIACVDALEAVYQRRSLVGQRDEYAALTKLVADDGQPCQRGAL